MSTPAPAPAPRGHDGGPSGPHAESGRSGHPGHPGHPEHPGHPSPGAYHEGGDHADHDMADVLDLDASVSAPVHDAIGSWVAALAADAGLVPARVLDLGAGTGVGTLALARLFRTAQVVAVDASSAMLDRVRRAASQHHLDDRVVTQLADLDHLDDGGLGLGPADLVWASSSLHHVTAPEALFAQVRQSLAGGGLVVAVELDSLPRFLPDDPGIGQPGLESRLFTALDAHGWNSHPDWGPHLERAGFDVVRQTFSLPSTAALPPDVDVRTVRTYARTFFSRYRTALADELAGPLCDDLATLDALLAPQGPHSLDVRADLTVRSSRTVWVGR